MAESDALLQARNIQTLQDNVWNYYREFGRDLVWRHDPTPYQVFVSEVMLQQTQVARVASKYPEWLARFPDFTALAAAPTADVLVAWQGMGYNRRALWLKAAAVKVAAEYAGILPDDPGRLVTLPGIGPNTAGSIAAFAYDRPVVFIETNIRRVFVHEFFPEAQSAGRTVADHELMPLISAALDREHPRQWYYALMDYGAMLARTVPNPNRRSRHYVRQSKFEGSARQLRGEVLRRLLVSPASEAGLRSGPGDVDLDDPRLAAVLHALVGEGFITRSRQTYSLSK